MKILVVSPHPDDETLGAGGTLLKLKRKGNQIFWLNVTNMQTDDGWDQSLVEHRKDQITLIQKFYNFDGFYNLNLPPTKLMSIDENSVIEKVKYVFEEVRPDWIFIPGNYDAHSDHVLVYNSCMVCAKTFRSPYIKRIMSMEILSETNFGFHHNSFKPNMFVDITDQISDKIEALKIYDTEFQESPFPRSVENVLALASVRGSQCMSKYAEAFEIIKQIE